MRGEFYWLKDLILNDCPQAYYIPFSVHQFQLALVVVWKKVIPVHQYLKPKWVL